MSFSKIDFLEQIKKLLISSNIKNVVIFNSVKKTQFPLVVIDFGVMRNQVSKTDSSRRLKYIDLPIIIEIYTKDKEKEIKCLEIEQNIINCIQNSKELQNLQLETSMQLPHLDKTVYRWRISYNAVIDVENNGII
jgi:hypothetical protein